MHRISGSARFRMSDNIRQKGAGVKKISRAATCKIPMNEGTPLRRQRQNDFIVVAARREAPGATSSEEGFAGDSGEF